MAPSGLQKALSFEAVRLASQERIQQVPPSERSSERFGDQNLERRPNLAAHQGPDSRGFHPRHGANSLWLCRRWWSSWRKCRRRCPRAVQLLFCRSESLRGSGGLSGFIEAAKTSSQDQNLQRTVEQNLDDTWYDPASRSFERIRGQIGKRKEGDNSPQFEDGSTEFVFWCLPFLVG